MRGEDCTRILHSVFENSALKVLPTQLEINALATKKKKLKKFPSCIENFYTEWKDAFWRNGRENTLRQLTETGMAGLQKV